MERKEAVLEIIEKNPGIRFNEIMRISNIRNGTLSHYVKKLEEEKKKLETLKAQEELNNIVDSVIETDLETKEQRIINVHKW